MVAKTCHRCNITLMEFDTVNYVNFVMHESMNCYCDKCESQFVLNENLEILMKKIIEVMEEVNNVKKRK